MIGRKRDKGEKYILPWGPGEFFSKFTEGDYLRLALRIARDGRWKEVDSLVSYSRWIALFELEMPEMPTSVELCVSSTSDGKVAFVWVPGFFWRVKGDELEQVFKALLEREDFRSWVLSKEI